MKNSLNAFWNFYWLPESAVFNLSSLSLLNVGLGCTMTDFINHNYQSKFIEIKKRMFRLVIFCYLCQVNPKVSSTEEVTPKERVYLGVTEGLQSGICMHDKLRVGGWGCMSPSGGKAGKAFKK